jgi:DNA-binding sugar fermentation-stimulating protein
MPKMTFDYESGRWLDGDEINPVLLKRYKKFLADLENEKKIILHCIENLGNK